MRAPVSWIRDYADLPLDLSAEDLAARLTALGLKLESLDRAGQVSGPLVVGRVLGFADEPQKNGKVIRWCSVDVGHANGTGEPQGIVCGAHNFAVGDLVIVSLPGAVLPGGFEIAARKTYGHVSDGMICSVKELGIGEEYDGILVFERRPGEVVEPGDDASALLHLREEVLEFEINPDRAYALSLRGVAREAALGFGAAFRDPAQRPLPAPNDAGYPVVVDDPAGCPVFVTRTVTGFDPTAPTPRWLARRVQLAGMRPISLAVDVTNYVMLELGQPIHGYDGDKLTGPIVVRRAAPGETLTTLDGVLRTLDEQDLLITDGSGPLGLAGVMGGRTTELSATTSTVVIEAAHFEPVTVFRTQRRHRLPSEASKRFERGVDPQLPPAAADRVAELLVEHGGGSVTDGVTYVGAAPERHTVTMSTALPAEVTGMVIDADTSIAHLRAVGCEVGVSGDRLGVVVPSWRPDLRDPFDLVEEVARLVGYDRIPSVLPDAPAGRGLTPAQSLRRRVGRTLAGSGFVEVVNFPFVGSADFDRLGLAPDDERRDALRLANPISVEAPAMTTTLLPGLLTALSRNVSRGQRDVALFEAATVTFPRGRGAAPILPVDRPPSPGEWDDLDKALPEQPLHLALTLAGNREPSGWWGPGRAAGWADAVATVVDVASCLGLTVEARSSVRAPWHPGRCAELLVGEVSVGFAGELHPKVCTSYGIPARTAAAEIDLDVLLERARLIAPAPMFSGYPVAKEDVALVVDADLPAAAVEATLREGAGDLLESVRLFDVYTGDQVPQGRKSLAFALRFRAPDRTLTEAEAAAARNAAVALAVARHDAVHRS